MSAGRSRLGRTKLGQDGAIRLPFGSATWTLASVEKCLPA